MRSAVVGTGRKRVHGADEALTRAGAQRGVDDEDVDESAGQEAAPDPDVDAIPSLTTLAPAYDRLLKIATQRLDGPVQTRVRTWEDGDFEIRVYHGYGPHPQRPDTGYHHVLRYYSRDDKIVEALMAVDTETVVVFR